MTGGNFEGGPNSGGNGSGGGDVCDELPPRDLARSKGLAVELEMSGEVQAE